MKGVNIITENTTASLMENKHVQDLLGIMEANAASGMKDFIEVLNHVTAMEKQLNTAVKELQVMRRELSESQVRNHPIITALHNTVTALEKSIAALRQRLNEAKQTIINGCKNAVTACKEKGVSALDTLARFFKLKPLLISMQNELDKNIEFDDAAIAKIKVISAEYHEAARHLKNMSRAVTGKETLQEANPAGKLAKVFEAPFRKERSLFVSMKKDVEAALGGLTRLEERARKPSIKQTLQKFNEQIAEAQKDAPSAERPRSVTHEER